MGRRIGGSRFRLRRGPASQARPMGSDRRRGPGPRARTWLGWAAAALSVGLVAFLVGRAGSEPGLPSPTPSPSAPSPLAITYGTALDPVSGEATQPSDRFRQGDPFTYSVRMPAPPGVDTILVEIIRLNEDGSETVAQRPSEQKIVATSPVFAFEVLTTDLLQAWGPGTYAMRIYLPGATDPFAAGRFTLVETPVAS
jgi:hypothetical protein